MLTQSFWEPQRSRLGLSRALLVLWVKTSCLPEKEGGLGWGGTLQPAHPLPPSEYLLGGDEYFEESFISGIKRPLGLGSFLTPQAAQSGAHPVLPLWLWDSG